jgi:hypothetical protein
MGFVGRLSRSAGISVFAGFERIYKVSGISVLGAVLSLLAVTVACGGAKANFVQPPPSFTLSASPSALSLQQGSSGSNTITVNSAGGFSGSVSLTTSTLPSGVTASFSATSIASTSTLTLNASSSAATGTNTITITGTSGSLTTSTTVNLTVFVPPPPGSIPASFFALNNVDPTDDPAADGMSYGAVGHPIRLAWPYIETSRGVYDFSFYDEYAAIAPREGPGGIVAVMDLTLGMTPGWAVSNHSTCRNTPDGVVKCQAPPDNIQDWKDFVTAVVQHYNGSSSARPYIKYYEIWNEWNVNDATNGFYSGTIPQLVALEQAACTIIHAQVVNFSLVVAPSTVGSASSANDQAPQKLQQFFNAGGNNCIDAVSFHGNLGLMSLNPYPLPGEGCAQSGCNGTIVEITNSYRQILNTNGLQTTPLLDTEGGFESANITDSDQRAAWLAQFYVLQGGLFNADELQWVSWFTWGSPGVAGNIETANRTPDTAGIAYNQVYNWMFGRLPSACTKSGTVWTCDLTGAASYQAEIFWDDSKTCNSGNCTTGAQIAPGWAVRSRDLTGKITTITGGSNVQVGLKPIILENQ